jgi:lipopolysaccharide transport system ATP-binding protein
MEQSVASLQRISKRYYKRGARRLVFSEWLEPRHSPDAFWALKDVTLDIHRGERVGLIGRNGAGKTTLLRTLSGLVQPAEGVRQICGQVLAVSEVQAGFHRELTGRENLAFLGLLAGISPADLRGRVDDIVSFAGLDRATFDTPVKNYSSGMTTRLGLSVALCVGSDLLLMDEGLVSGDADFRLRVRARLRQMAALGCAQVIVSHELTDLREECERLVYMRAGEVAADGRCDEVFAAYERDVAEGMRR